MRNLLNLDILFENVRVACDSNSRYCSLPDDLQADVLHEVHAKAFITIANGASIDEGYLYSLVKFHFQQRTYIFPHVRKEMARISRESAWKIRQPQIGMSRRQPEPTPLEQLIEKEDEDELSSRMRTLRRAIRRLSKRERSVIARYLDGKALTTQERNVRHRAIVKLKTSITSI